MSQKNTSNKINVSQDFIERFKARTTKMDNGCLAWNGGKNIRLPDGGYITPRRAAYLIKHKEMPTREIKLACHTQSCVEPKHFLEGRAAKTGTKSHEERLSETDKALIAKLRRQKNPVPVKELAAKFKVSVGTIDRYDPTSNRDRF